MLGQARRRGEVVAAAQWYKTHIDIAKVGNPVNNLMESAVAAYADNVFLARSRQFARQNLRVLGIRCKMEFIFQAPLV